VPHRTRKLNPILTIRPVESGKDLKLKDTDKQLSMQFLFGRVTGQEDLESNPKRRKALLATPMTPQTGETERSRSETESRPTTSRSRSETESRPATGQSKPFASRPVTGVTFEDITEGTQSITGPSAEDLHERRKSLQSGKSVRFFNQETEETQKWHDKGKQTEKDTMKPRGSRKRTQLSRTRYFQGTRNMSKDMSLKVHANFASVFNPKHNEFWLAEDFPSPWIVVVDFQGQVLRKIHNFEEFYPSFMTIDTNGNLYASNGDCGLYKFAHHRYFDPVYQTSTDKMTRMSLASPDCSHPNL
jgi:hypothetical protein